MSGKYKAVGWNRQKKIYDGVMAASLLGVLTAFVTATVWLRPGYPLETLVLRGTSLCAILLLHVILIIGPLARLDRRFLPLLYNRRHLGVTMCCFAGIHAAFAIAYYHGQAVVNPLVGAFTAYRTDYVFWRDTGGLAHVPFEPFGALALVILFLMAATSHDFWLRVLGASFWKSLHLLVYVAYASIIIHVALGVLQDERDPIYLILLGCGLTIVLGLHLAAGLKEARADRLASGAEADGFVFACKIDELADGHGKAVQIGDERRAIFRHNDRIYALSNVCRHQGGPVGEGRILDGCITCPWHGWQYLPDTGTSPPPFHEVIATYPVRVIDAKVYVNPTPNPPDTKCNGALAGELGGWAMNDEFYIGYRKTAPPRLARFVAVIAASVALVVVTTALIVGGGQQPAGDGSFSFGNPETFEGVVRAEPMLHINVLPGAHPALVVDQGKHGAPEYITQASGKHVRMQATRIERDGMLMLETTGLKEFEIVGEASSGQSAVERSAASIQLTGELVDTKCYLGVMNPGRGKIHRGCAAECLRGGVPPGLLVQEPDGTSQVVILQPAGGAAMVNPEWAARTIVASGVLDQIDGLYVLTYDRVDLVR